MTRDEKRERMELTFLLFVISPYEKERDFGGKKLKSDRRLSRRMRKMPRSREAGEGDESGICFFQEREWRTM